MKVGVGSATGGLPPVQWAMLGSLLLAIALANVAQPYPELAPLQHIPTVIFTLSAPFLLRRWPIDSFAVAFLWIFLLLHTLGGRYIYSNVPYNDWWLALVGRPGTEMVGGDRNAYDRLVHFMFGLLCTPVFAHIAIRYSACKKRLSWFLAFAIIGLVSALYEVFEWLLTIVAAGDTADYYNGQQGDQWDAQKDMALAQLGSGIAIVLASIKSRLFPA